MATSPGYRRLETWQLACLMLVLASASLSIAVNQLALGLGLLLLLARGVRRGGWPSRTALFWPALLLAAWAAVMIPLSTAPSQSLLFYRRFFLVTAYWVALAATDGERARQWAFVGAAGGALILAVIGLVRGLQAPGGLFGTRFEGTMNAMTCGVQSMMVLLTAIGLLLVPRQRRAVRALALPVALLLGVTLVQTMTRSALLGLMAGMGAMILTARPRLAGAFAAVVVLALLVVYGSGGRVLPERLWARLEPATLVHSTSGWGPRLEMWKGGWEMLKDRPLTGVGDRDLLAIAPQYYGDETTVYHGHLHSNPVMLAAIWGLPGLALAAVFMFVPLLLLVRRWRDLGRRPPGAAGSPLRAGWLVGAVGVWAGFFVAGLTEWYFGDAEAMVLYLSILGVALSPVAGPEGGPLLGST